MNDLKNNIQKREQKSINNGNICRLCMAKCANIPIFPNKREVKNKKGPPLVCKIMSCVNIQVKKDDALSKFICEECETKVEKTYEFLRLCEVSDSFLRQYLDFGMHISLVFRYSDFIRLIDSSDEEDFSDSDSEDIEVDI